MAFYVFRPEPDDIAKESLEFHRRLKSFARARLDYAERTRDAVYANYENSPASQWQWGPTLDNAAQNFEQAEREFKAIAAKVAWEEKADWDKHFPKPSLHAMPRPWMTDQKAWLKCFELGADDKV